MIHDLEKAGFARFGDVIERGERPFPINGGNCQRHHNLGRLSFDKLGCPGVSIFDAKIRQFPYEFKLMERHPLGSQTFLPMDGGQLLIVVADDKGGQPDKPVAVVSQPTQGVNILRGVWHGILTPIAKSGLFAVVDWIGDKANLDTYEFNHRFRVVR